MERRLGSGRDWFNSPLVASLLTALLYCAFTVCLWNARGRDVSRFIVLGASSVDRSHVPPHVALLPDNKGYDGTSFYRLALDPFTRRATDFGITLDLPAYRQQRILYPFLVWCLSAGHQERVPALLVWLNLAAVAGLSWFGACLARQFGRHALWGIVFSLYPGLLYSVTRDLCEPLACAFGLAAIVAITSRRPITGAVLLSCSILTRETFLVLAAAFAVFYVLSRVRSSIERVSPVVFLLPFGVYIAWQATLAFVWGVTPLRAGAVQIELAIPFAGYWRVLTSATSLRGPHRLHFAEAAYLGIVALLVIASWLRSRGSLAWKLAWVGELLLMGVLARFVWEEDVAYMRVLSDYFVIGTALIVTSNRALRWVLAICTLILWCYLATHLVKYS